MSKKRKIPQQPCATARTTATKTGTSTSDAADKDRHESTDWYCLSTDVVCRVSQCLDVFDAAALGRVCRTTRELSRRASFWCLHFVDCAMHCDAGRVQNQTHVSWQQLQRTMCRSLWALEHLLTQVGSDTQGRWRPTRLTVLETTFKEEFLDPKIDKDGAERDRNAAVRRVLPLLKASSTIGCVRVGSARHGFGGPSQYDYNGDKPRSIYELMLHLGPGLRELDFAPLAVYQGLKECCSLLVGGEQDASRKRDFSGLRRLALPWRYKDGGRDGDLGWANLGSVLARLPSLTDLDARGYSYHPGYPFPTSLPTLQRLALPSWSAEAVSWDKWHDESCEETVYFWPELTHLHLETSRGVSGTRFIHMPKLTHLSIAHDDERAVLSLPRLFSNLVSLTIGPPSSDASVCHHDAWFSQLLQALQLWPRLAAVDISRADWIRADLVLDLVQVRNTRLLKRLALPGRVLEWLNAVERIAGHRLCREGLILCVKV